MLDDGRDEVLPGLRASAAAFCVNVPAEGQHHVGSAFARSGGDKFEGVRWSPGTGGAPLLAGACAWISCELVQERGRYRALA